MTKKNINVEYGLCFPIQITQLPNYRITPVLVWPLVFEFENYLIFIIFDLEFKCNAEILLLN